MAAAPENAMAAVVPSAVLRVCRTLRDAGFQAWIVGGAVRDLVLGKVPSDWDVASDALPEKVLELFDKTIATGLQHGTVTALVGRGAERESVEITTFRGEGAYSDSRRPDAVHFGVPLDEDLKRRDFVINAMAFDPIDARLHDPFGGAADLQDRRIRAVGVASERFNEDGLRVMRAVRFVSTLDFELDEATEEGMRTALGALGQVAQERVRVELLKLLAGAAPARALELARRNGVLAVVLPELEALPLAEAFGRMAALSADPCLRLGALLAGLSSAQLEPVLRRLTLSNEERHRVVGMLRGYDLQCRDFADEGSWRRHLSRVGRVHARDCLDLLEAEAKRTADAAFTQAISLARAVLASGVALEVRDLAIGGKEVMAETGARGPLIGDILQGLLDAVLDIPARNQREHLLALTRDLAKKHG